MITHAMVVYQWLVSHPHWIDAPVLRRDQDGKKNRGAHGQQRRQRVVKR